LPKVKTKGEMSSNWHIFFRLAHSRISKIFEGSDDKNTVRICVCYLNALTNMYLGSLHRLYLQTVILQIIIFILYHDLEKNITEKVTHGLEAHNKLETLYEIPF
jgi:hypothetical protein